MMSLAIFAIVAFAAALFYVIYEIGYESKEAL